MSDSFDLYKSSFSSESALPARPIVPVVGPDRDVIIACNEFADLELERQRLWGAATSVALEEEAEREVAKTDRKFEQALLRLCTTRALTFAGVSAKLYALVVAEPGFLKGILEGSAVGGRVLASILHDVLS